MIYVIAKEKKENTYKKLCSVVDIYKQPEGLATAVEYTPTRMLEDDEWYKIETFSKREYCLDLLLDEFNTTDYTQVEKEDLNKIEYICAYETNAYYFQRILKLNLLQRKILKFGDKVSLDDTGKSIVINEFPDAIYLKEKDTLYFKKLETIAPIFKGIEILYREATNDETQEFVENDFITLGDGYEIKDIKRMNRKRITLAMKILEDFDETQKKEIFQYTNEYFPNLKYENNCFEIRNEEEMKLFLWGIEQRCYTTPVTKEKRVANSVFSLN